MENNTNTSPVLGFDDFFEDGVIVDGSGVELTEVDKIMKSICLKDDEIYS